MPKHKELTRDQAAAVHWFLDHLCFDDYLSCIPPHLSKDVRTDKAYEIRDALSALQEIVPTAASGDWMYRV